MGTYYVFDTLLGALHTNFHAVLQQLWGWYHHPLVKVRLKLRKVKDTA